MRLFFLSLIFALPGLAQATVIQILHTNDLHASLETAGAPRKGEPEFGGWARVKTLMDSLTGQARVHGIETVRLDAGDYSEGSLAYFADRGARVLTTFQHMGYDATALGNHDWLMGSVSMDKLYGEHPFPFPVLSANAKISSKLKNLKSQIIPSMQILRGGVKIGIFGLSTNESLYSWIPDRVGKTKKEFRLGAYGDEEITDGVYKDPTIITGVANKMIRKLRGDNDVVIALSHIGLASDEILAAHTRGLDLIVGGHSHTILESSASVKDLDGKDVQIVQAGFNGHYVGKILLEVDAKKNPSVRVLSYELVPVTQDLPSDPVIASDIAAANAALANAFPGELDDVAGTSEVRLLSGDSGPTAFSKFAVDSMRAQARTEIAFDVGAFHGNTPQPAGNITHKMLKEMYPRKFEEGQKEGLYIYEARVPGFLIKEALTFAMEYGKYISTSGINYEVGKLSNAEFEKLKSKHVGSEDYSALTPYFPKNIRVGLKPLKSLHWYSAAAPESLVRGGFGVNSLFKIIVRHAHRTPYTLWGAMIAHLMNIHTIQKLKPEDQFHLLNGVGDNSSNDLHRNANPFDDGEGFVVPWINDYGSDSSVISNSLGELIKEVKPGPQDTSPGEAIPPMLPIAPHLR